MFSKQEFVRKASDKFVLVTIDFPNRGNQDPAQRRRNEALAKKFKVGAFPTLLLLDARGRPYAEAGMVMNVRGHAAQLLELRKKRVERDARFSEAGKLAGAEKADSLADALAELKLPTHYLNTFYGDVIAEIQKSSPENKSGLSKGGAAKAGGTETKKRFLKKGRWQRKRG